jgi:prepilin-type processing-associated H-X9-DG protein/prepilin-type N-terminal cleavage/methylation domain-containing protein
MRRNRAYTLVEMLVVIGVIGILVSILVPVLARARASAARAACANNMRQLSAAYVIYANANRDTPPGAANLRAVLVDAWVHWQRTRRIDESALAAHLSVRGGGLEALLRCPLAPPPMLRPGSPLCRITYSMNTGLWRGYWQGEPRLKVTQVRNPSAKALLYDEDAQVDDGAFWYEFGDVLTNRHDGRGNIAYFDGHVEPQLPRVAHERQSNDPRY